MRPRTRAECRNASRPCPWISCRYHLFEEVAPRILKVKVDELGDVSNKRLIGVLLRMEYTCVLDWAEKGPNTLEQIGKMFGVTRERIRQIQDRGLKRLGARCTWSAKRDIVELLTDMGERIRVRGFNKIYKE